MKLYDAPPLGNYHKAWMMLSLLGPDYDKASIVLSKTEQKSADHLVHHPLGKVPALEDGDVTVWETQAILVLLVSKYDSANKLLPADLEVQAHVTEWLFFVTKEMWDGPAVA